MCPTTHLDVDKDAMISLKQHFVALGLQRELKRDLCLACWDFTCPHHFNVTAYQLDRLQQQTTMLWVLHAAVKRVCGLKLTFTEL